MVLVSDKPSNDIGILQTKLSDRERHETRRVGLEPTFRTTRVSLSNFGVAIHSPL